MAYQTPRTWTTSELVTAAMMNQDVRDNISFLANPPACRVYHNANQSIAHNTVTVPAFNSERFDTDSMHSTVTNTGRITFNTAGVYVVSFSGAMAAGTDYTEYAANIRLNGTIVLGDQRVGTMTVSASPHVTVTTIYKFAAADYVEVTVKHVNGASAARNLLVNGSNTPEFSAVWVGLG